MDELLRLSCPVSWIFREELRHYRHFLRIVDAVASGWLLVWRFCDKARYADHSGYALFNSLLRANLTGRIADGIILDSNSRLGCYNYLVSSICWSRHDHTICPKWATFLAAFIAGSIYRSFFFIQMISGALYAALANSFSATSFRSVMIFVAVPQFCLFLMLLVKIKLHKEGGESPSC